MEELKRDELIAKLKLMPRRVVLETLVEVCLESQAYDQAITAINELKRIQLKEVNDL